MWYFRPPMSTDGGARVEYAHAKINLFLEVLGRRADGYHDIQSIVVPVSLFDTLTLERTPAGIETVFDPAGEFSADSIGLRAPAANLTTRAALALQAQTGYTGGARITLTKRIPAGGGMGGGSADAAAVLRGLNTLWGLELDGATLARIGAGLGCDIPALLQGGAVRMEGVGERVSPIPLDGAARVREWWVVLVNPGFSILTADVYARYRALTSPPIPYMSMVCAFKEGDWDRVAGGLFNSLEATVFRKYPLAEVVADALRQAGASGVLLSGSGASVFGLVAGRAEAEAVAGRVRARLDAALWVRVARLLPDGVMAAHDPLEVRV